MLGKIPFSFQCPGFFQRTCDNKDPVNWVHNKCRTPVYIDTDGDIYCKNGCYIPSDNRFIQHWRFSCSFHAGKYFEFVSVGDLMYALGNASHATNAYDGGDKKAISAFFKKLASRINEKWKEYDGDD